MKCTLMNKFTEVLEAEYNEKLKVFTSIYKIKNKPIKSILWLIFFHYLFYPVNNQH